MKKLFLFLFVCFMYTVGFAEGIGGGGGSGGPDIYSLFSTACHINASGDDSICISKDTFTLNGSVSSPTNPFPSTYNWQQIAGPSTVTILSPTTLSTQVYGPFVAGTYTFTLCAMCADSNIVCDTVNIVVTSTISNIAVIQDTFGNPINDNPLQVCTRFKVFGNPPGVGENANWGFLTFDPNYTQSVSGNSCTGVYTPSSNCSSQRIYYTISNGGCKSYDTLNVFFYRQDNPPIIYYPADSAHLCGSTVPLYSTGPGCTGIVQWSLLSMPAGATTPVINSPNSQYASATIYTSGYYTFTYSVDTSGPCPGGNDTVTFYVCVSNLNGLGNSTVHYYCDAYPDTILLHSNWDPTFVYDDWKDYYNNGSPLPVVINHIPADTGGMAIILDQNVPEYIFWQRALVGQCIDGQDTLDCYSYIYHYYRKEASFAAESDTVNYFCGGVQGFYPHQHVQVVGISGITIRPILVPPGSPINLVNYGWGTPFDLQIPGQYIFQIFTTPYSGDTNCRDTINLYVNVSSLENPSAGSNIEDSICNTDTLTLTGSLPINIYTNQLDPNAVVLWQQASGPSTLTFINPANSQVVNLTGFQVGTYVMVYSFSLDPSCLLTDTMIITIYPCDTTPPPLDSCISIINDSMWCDGSGYYMHFCIHNSANNAWNLNSFQLVTPPGVTISSISQPAGSGFVALAPQYYYFYNLPSTAPGSNLCDFVVQVSGVTPGSSVCFYAIGHDEDTIPSANCCLDSSNYVCLNVPTCRDTCGYITDSLYCLDGILYYSYTIHNISNFTIDGYKIYMTPPAGGVQIASITATIPPMGTYTGTPIDLSSFGLTFGSTACFYAKLFSTHMLGGVACIDTTCWTDTNCYRVPRCGGCCGYWGTNSFTYYPTPGGFPVSRIMNCGDAIPYNCPRLDNMYNFQYFCGRVCSASFTATMYDPSHNPIWSGSAIGNYWSINGNTIPFGVNGTYQLVVYAYCDGHLCDSCIITIRKDCPTCVCGEWIRTYYQGYGTTGLPISIPFTCGDAIRYNCPPLDNVYSFQYQCRGECNPTYSATLTDALGAVLWTGTYTGSLYNITGLPITTNGTYTLTVNVTCGDVRCEGCRIRIVRDCPPECTCGEWIRTYYQGYGTTGLPISIPFTCGDAIRYNCPPLDNVYTFQYQCRGECSPTYNAVLTDALGTVLWTGTYTGSVYNITGLPITTNGTYTLTVNVVCGGVRCGSCRISIVRDCPPACTCGEWIRTYYQGYGTTGLPISIPFTCGDAIRYNCPPLDNVYSFQYQCRGECSPTYNAVLTDALGAVLWTGTYTGSVYNITGLPITTNGTYTLTVNVVCGGVRCEGCRISIVRDCPPCVCGEWVRTYYQGYDRAGLPVSVPFTCGETIRYNCPPLDNVYSFQYQCRGECNPTYRATLTDGSGTILWSGSYTGSIYNITGLPITTNGAYYLHVDVYCGGRLCDRCDIRIIRECAPCECGEWVRTFYQGYDREGLPVSVPFDCGAEIPYNCPPLDNIYSFQYQCRGECNPTYEATLFDDSGSPIWTGTFTGSVYNITGLPITTDGYYTLNVVVYCGGVACGRCAIRINKECRECECGNWGHIGYSDKATGDEFVPYDCGKEISHACREDLFIYNDYFCIAPCVTSMVSHVYDQDGNDLGTYSVIGTNLSWTIPGSVFNASGHYTVVTTAYCGGKECAECVLNVFVECPDCCGEWIRTSYLTYDGHGSPISEKFDCGATIHYNCPPLSNAYTFEYRCNEECYPLYKATLYDVDGTPIWTGTYTGSVYTIAGLPIYSNGTFTLHVDVYCGGNYCDKCDIRIIAECHFPDCCGEWASNYIDDFSNPHGPISVPFNCGDSKKVDCSHRYHILFNYRCKDECPTSYYTFLEAPDGSVTTLTYVGTSLDYVANFTMSGTYKLHVYVYCGGKLCSECVVYLDADCGKMPARKSDPSKTIKDKIQVFPNPALDFISISTLNEAIKLVEIYDLNGKLVLTNNFNQDLRNATIDLTSINSGSYIISINKTIQRNITISK